MSPRKALIFVTLFTLLTFAIAGIVAPDPIIKPDNTVKIWGSR